MEISPGAPPLDGVISTEGVEGAPTGSGGERLMLLGDSLGPKVGISRVDSRANPPGWGEMGSGVGAAGRVGAGEKEGGGLLAAGALGGEDLDSPRDFRFRSLVTLGTSTIPD